MATLAYPALQSPFQEALWKNKAFGYGTGILKDWSIHAYYDAIDLNLYFSYNNDGGGISVDEDALVKTIEECLKVSNVRCESKEWHTEGSKMSIEYMYSFPRPLDIYVDYSCFQSPEIENVSKSPSIPTIEVKIGFEEPKAILDPVAEFQKEMFKRKLKI